MRCHVNQRSNVLPISYYAIHDLCGLNLYKVVYIIQFIENYLCAFFFLSIMTMLESKKEWESYFLP